MKVSKVSYLPPLINFEAQIDTVVDSKGNVVTVDTVPLFSSRTALGVVGRFTVEGDDGSTQFFTVQVSKATGKLVLRQVRPGSDDDEEEPAVASPGAAPPVVIPVPPQPQVPPGPHLIGQPAGPNP